MVCVLAFVSSALPNGDGFYFIKTRPSQGGAPVAANLIRHQPKDAVA